jgi:hypothetical protein
MKLYSFPTIFHYNIGFDDSPDYIRVCASNKDTQEEILKHLQASPENMIYGPFKTITYDSPCNVRNAERTHYIIPIPAGLKHNTHPRGDKPSILSSPKT